MISASSTTVDEQLRQIRASLLSHSGFQRTGSQLRSLIAATCPDFDLRAAAGVPFGPGALTKLLQDHFADIVHPIGRSGLDRLFSIGAAPSRAVALEDRTPPPPTANLWTAFASPSLGQRLAYDPSSKRLSSFPFGATVPTEQIALPPITSDEFRVIANDFLAEVAGPLRVELQESLSYPDFFPRWASTLSSKQPSEYRRWGLFRVRAILDLFRRRLAAAGVPPTQQEALAETLAADQSRAHKERVSARSRAPAFVAPGTLEQSQQPTSPAQPACDGGAVAHAKLVARAVLENMSVSELRLLMVPLGAVVDAGVLPRS